MKNIRYKIHRYDDTIKPLIVSARWGRTRIKYQGTDTLYKDVMLWNDGHKRWDWKKSDTHHVPGIVLHDVRELVEKRGCDYLILSRGYENVLQIHPDTISYLREGNVRYIILNSIDAINEYNVNTSDNVGMLFHATC